MLPLPLLPALPMWKVVSSRMSDTMRPGRMSALEDEKRREFEEEEKRLAD